MAKLVRPEDFQGPHADQRGPDRHRAEIQKFFDAGIDAIYLHNVGRNQSGGQGARSRCPAEALELSPTIQKGETCKHNRLSSTATAHG
jgi:hypothetical protein